MKVCRCDKYANPNSCGGCEYGCVEKPAIKNEDFEKAVRDMEESTKKKVAMSYTDKQGNEVFVSCGLGLNTYGTFRRSTAGGLHRVKSPAMPMVSSREEAQANLDKWARNNKLEVKAL